MKLPKCPYCGKQMGYVRAFFTRNQGEYFCKRCRKESNVVISKGVFIPFVVALVFAIFILLAFFMLTDRENLWFMLFVAVPFIIFYMFTPFFVTLKPKKKHADSLYDTDMVESTIVTPDPTMANASKVTPTFIDDVIIEDEEYKPTIDADVFNTIKNDRKAVSEVDGGTKPITSYEELSSNNVEEKTMPVKNIEDIKNEVRINNDSFADDPPKTEGVKIYKKEEPVVKVDIKENEEEKVQEMKDVINSILSDDDESSSLSDIKLDVDLSDLDV